MATRSIVPRGNEEGSLGRSDRKWKEVHAANLYGLGVIPIGSIVAFLPGYFTGNSNNNYTHVILDGVTMNTESNVNTWLQTYGFAVCNGADPVASGLIAAGESPIFDTTGKYLPKLNDDRFIQGSFTSIGSIGGDNILHAHYHTAIENLNVTINVSGKHTHNTNYTGKHEHGYREGGHWHDGSWVDGDGSADVLHKWQNTAPAGGHSHTTNTTGDHTHVAQVSGHIGNSSGISGDIDHHTNRPKYISVFYIMRIK